MEISQSTSSLEREIISLEKRIEKEKSARKRPQNEVEDDLNKATKVFQKVNDNLKQLRKTFNVRNPFLIEFIETTSVFF